MSPVRGKYNLTPLKITNGKKPCTTKPVAHQENKNKFRLMIYLIICIYSSANLNTGECSFSSWKRGNAGKFHILGSSSNSFSPKTPILLFVKRKAIGMKEICIVYEFFHHTSSVLWALRTGTRGISFLHFATEGELGFYANPSEGDGSEEKEGPGRRKRQGDLRIFHHSMK